MRPSHHDEGEHHQRNRSTGSTEPQSGTPCSSYVSTLSNALNITPKPKVVHPDPHQSAPAKLARAASTPKSASPSKAPELRTPTRNREPPPILSLSGHKAFESPNTPGSPWISAQPTSAAPVGGHAMKQGQHGHAGHPSASTAADQDWFTFAPSSSRTRSIFEIKPGTAASVTGGASWFSSVQDSSKSASKRDNTTEQGREGCSAIPGTFAPATFSSYRDPLQPLDASDMQSANQHEMVAHSTLSPTLAAALSPAQISSSFPSNVLDDSFLSSIFEHGTPSLSTHFLPDGDLTQYLATTSAPSATPDSTPVSGIANADAVVQAAGSMSHAIQISVNDRSTSRLSQPVAFGQAVDPVSEGWAEFVRHDAAVTRPKPSGSSQLAESGLALNQQSSLRLRADHDYADVGMPDSIQTERHGSTGSSGGRLAGLGLDLNTTSAFEHVEVLTSPKRATNRPSMSVDEMGRWMPDPRPYQSEPPWLSEAGSAGSKAAHERWTAHRTSMASLSASTEASLTSQSNSSTWDSSFNEPASPAIGAPLASADSQSVTTPASSVGFSGSRNSASSKFADQLRTSSDVRSPTATPEVSMHDFSEFGQSVSIEHMAEQRWRTWPRNAGTSIQRDASSNSAVVNHLSADEPRVSIDSLSVSTSSTRSRLMAEPYNKNMRSGRPSSSASTSSRSSVGNAAALEAQQMSGGTGPTRPRSHIATGSLRMSTTARTTSSVGAGPDTTQNTGGERMSGTAMALRRARGMSHSVFSPSSSSAMKSTRSADAFMSLNAAPANVANFRHSASMQRAATSIDASRPQSMLDASSHSGSPRKLGSGTENKAKGRVGFNEVSAALDTLCMFLKQKSGSETNTTADQSPTKSKEASSPSKPIRTLRRAKGVLPPRGVVSHVDEFGTLHTGTSTSNAADLSHNSASNTCHKRSQSLGGATFSSQSSRRDDRLAVLEDVSERVLRLKAETELEQERHAAASMPPPTARPASMMHSRTQSSMTRREMHEEYLRKRASGS